VSSHRTLKQRAKQLLLDLRYGWDDESSPRSDAETLSKIVLIIVAVGVFARCRSVGIQIPIM
jgi:hypothetical protein